LNFYSCMTCPSLYSQRNFISNFELLFFVALPLQKMASRFNPIIWKK